jgi:hypothetical protein
MVGDRMMKIASRLHGAIPICVVSKGADQRINIYAGRKVLHPYSHGIFVVLPW